MAYKKSRENATKIQIGETTSGRKHDKFRLGGG